ncbi:MAG: ABC transporter ATP-binding protein [Kiritimatiellia bacterium]
MTPEEDIVPQFGLKLWDRRLAGRFLAFTKPYKRWIVAGMVVMILLTLVTVVVPLLIRDAVDHHIQGAVGTEIAARTAGLAHLCALAALASLLIFLLRGALAYLVSWLGQQVVNDLRTAVFVKILRLPVQYFDRNPSGKLMTRVTSDLEALQGFVERGVVGIAANLVMLVGIMSFMLVMDVWFALAMFVTLPFLLGILTWVNHLVRKAQRLVRTKQSNLNSILAENLAGMRTIQIFNRQDASLDRFRGANNELRDAQLTANRHGSWYFPVIEIMRAVATILLLATGAWLYFHGREATGTLVAFLQFYLREFFRPLEDLSDQSHVLQAAMVSAERVFKLLDEPEVVLDPPAPQPLEPFRGEVDFDDVSFAYDGVNDVLRHVSFHVPAGSSLALVGATGAGKSSIIALLSRFHDVRAGAVRIDGKDVRAVAQSDLRRRIGLVQQDPLIFSGTIASNISLNHPGLSREAVVAAAKFVHAHEFISRLPQGYDTPAGERGSTLSTGQKQLLALARAVVQNPDILLILDEATANVDTETEQLIQQAMDSVMRGRTSIIIAHRLSTIRHADQILVLRRGEIIERGRHDELLRQAGYYRTLYELLQHSPGSG